MEDNTCYAKKLLEKESYTCVLYDGKTTYTSTVRGVAPLLDWLTEGISFEGYCAADKVVGKAAAFLYALLDVKEVYAPVMSEPALKVLKKYGIGAVCDQVVTGIKNRQGTGPCPMEQATEKVSTKEEALVTIRKKREELQREKK